MRVAMERAPRKRATALYPRTPIPSQLSAPIITIIVASLCIERIHILLLGRTLYSCVRRHRLLAKICTFVTFSTHSLKCRIYRIAAQLCSIGRSTITVFGTSYRKPLFGFIYYRSSNHNICDIYECNNQYTDEH